MDPKPCADGRHGPIAGLNTHAKATRAEETRMLHPYMTAELVRQLRAGLDTEAHHQRLIRQLPPRARTGPEPGRFAATARTLAGQVRGLMARPT